MERLRAEAANEMRRQAPDDGIVSQPLRKKRRRELLDEQNETVDKERLVRYKYAAVEDLKHGCQGFLVTCPQRREMSATHEAAALLLPYLPATFQSSAGAGAAPPSMPDLRTAAPSGIAEATVDVNGTVLASSSPQPAAPALEHALALAEPMRLNIVKVNANSLVLLIIPPGDAAVEPVQVVRRLLQDLDAGRRPRPKFCDRIQPLETTCEITPEQLTVHAARVVKHCKQRQAAAGLPELAKTGLRFAVAYRSRGFEPAAPAAVGAAATCGSTPAHTTAMAADTAVDAQASPTCTASLEGGAQTLDAGLITPASATTPLAISTAPDMRAAGATVVAQALTPGPRLDRSAVIRTLASAMSEAFLGGAPAKVDLSTPQVAFLCDSIPVAGLQLFGLCTLEDDLFSAKPRLAIRSLGAVHK